MSRVDGKTRTLGLIGNPVEHTMSPFIQNLFAEAMNINMVYVPFHVDRNLEAAIKGAKALNLLGNNVTVPYKVDVMQYLDEIDKGAKVIGAVNTIHYKDGMIYGYNTDAAGFLQSCLKAGIVFEGKVVAILGAGGAAKAIAAVCAENKVSKIYLANRTLEKAENLKKRLLTYYPKLDVEVVNYDQLMTTKDIKICFQTTSIGMHPELDVSPITDNIFLSQLEWAVDAIYNPSETKFLKLARDNGVQTLNGLGMLFYQAVKAFELWHEIQMPEEIIDKCYERFYKYVYASTNN